MRAPSSLRAQALALLARREYSRSELRSRLLAHVTRQAAYHAAHAPHPSHDDASVEAPLTAATTRTRRQAPDAAARQAVDEVLDWLADQHLQSDARYAEARVHHRAASHGALRITHELAQQGVALSDAAATALRASEFERALALWQRRFGPVPPIDAKARARQGSYLLRRGFAGDVVQRVIQGRTAAD